MSLPSSGVPINVRKPSSSNDTGEAGPASPPPEGRDGSPAATVHATADASARCASHEEPSVPVGMLADARRSMGMGGGDAELAGASMLMGMGGEGPRDSGGRRRVAHRNGRDAVGSRLLLRLLLRG